MSDNLPFEMHVEIMKRLPVKSIIRFRSVSKTWKSLIDSSHFVAHYHTQLQHMLVTYDEPGDDDPYYVSIADDHTFPQLKVSHTIPLLVNMLMSSCIIGTSHGLFCLYSHYSKSRRGSISRTNMAVVWNPSIRRVIPVVVPNVAYGIYETVIGFGVCLVTSDPEIIKITYIKSESHMETITSIPWQVEVFTLSTRYPYSSNLPRKSIEFDWLQVVVDGFLYWRATDRIRMGGGYTSYNLIISFDITTEEFREVILPHSLARDSLYNVSLSKLRGSLVLQSGVEADNPVTHVWMMVDGVAKSFSKLFSVNVSTPDEAYVRGFRKSGEPIIEISEDDLLIYKLAVYDPYSKHIKYLGINGITCTFYVYPYMETLLLLDQPNLAAYNAIETIEYLDGLVP